MMRKLILFCLCLTACSKGAKDLHVSGKPQILVSIAPYRFLAERIAGPDFEVQTVVPANANPHTFEPTSHQVGKIGRSEIWFCIGEPFEGKMIPLLKERNPKIAIQDLREGLQLMEEKRPLSCAHCSMDHRDRHIWLSPKMAKEQALLIERTFSLKFPEKKEVFQKNFAQLEKDLVALDQEIGEILKTVEKRLILVSHPAFGYFCKDYGFDQLSVEYEGKDPRPKHLEEILKEAASQNMEVALALPQYNNKGAQLIAEKIHIPVRFIDPYSADYFETMRKLAHLIAEPYAD